MKEKARAGNSGCKASGLASLEPRNKRVAASRLSRLALR